MPEYEEIIQKSQVNIKYLSERLKDLDKLHQDIMELTKQPEIFDEKFKQIVKLSEDYTNTLGASTKKYLDGNNTLFTSKINEISSIINDLHKEISRLEKIDLEKHFDKHQKTLSDIFGSITSLNISLTSITQTLNGAIQSLGACNR